jgi:3-methyladenine DNA glycosylase AlkD
MQGTLAALLGFPQPVRTITRCQVRSGIGQNGLEDQAVPMTLKQAVSTLESLGNEKMRAQNLKNGSGDKTFGVPMGDIRKVAAKIKTDHELALALWDTGNVDARLLAVLVLKPASLSAADLDRMVKAANYSWLADWLNNYVVKQHPDKEKLRQKWMTAKDPWAARAGWTLTSERVSKSPQGLDVPALLDRIESEMPKAAPPTQWTMNSCLANIGIHFPALRKRAIAIGETLGIYRDFPCSKGCTSPFAPIWIDAMVKRQKA